MKALSDSAATAPNEFASIRQRISVPFEYGVHFTDNLLQLDNPLLANIVSPLQPAEYASEKASEQAEKDPSNAPLTRTIAAPKVLVVVDSGLPEQTALIGRIMAYAQAHAAQMTLVAAPLTVPGGEAAKNNPSFITDLCHVINVRNLCRHSYVIVFGGGALLDMVGYAAAIAHRGIRLIRVPTTVLAQNTAGVGVKNGINAFGKKNFLGTFTPPYAVVNDFSFLETLSDRDWRSGLAEAVKVALVKDRSFFEQIEQDAAALADRDMPAMKRLIHRCAQLHLEHTAHASDPFEARSACPLEFGYWVAHWLESVTDYRVKHGEAVAIGIALDTMYSQLSGILQPQKAMRILYTLQKLGFHLATPELFKYIDQPEHRQSIFYGLQEFREQVGGQLTIMLLWDIGQSVEMHTVELSHYREAIAILAARTQRGLTPYDEATVAQTLGTSAPSVAQAAALIHSLPNKNSSVESSPVESGSVESGSVESGSVESSPAESGSDENGSDESGLDQISSDENNLNGLDNHGDENGLSKPETAQPLLEETALKTAA